MVGWVWGVWKGSQGSKCVYGSHQQQPSSPHAPTSRLDDGAHQPAHPPCRCAPHRLLATQSGTAAGKDEGVGIMERTGLQYVRGCEVIEVRDEGAPLLLIAAAADCLWLYPGSADRLFGEARQVGLLCIGHQHGLGTAGLCAYANRRRQCMLTNPPSPALTSPSPDGKLMNDFTGRVRREEQGSPQGTVRTITVALDTAQYQVGAGLGIGLGLCNGMGVRALLWPAGHACGKSWMSPLLLDTGPVPHLSSHPRLPNHPPTDGHELHGQGGRGGRVRHLQHAHAPQGGRGTLGMLWLGAAACLLLSPLRLRCITVTLPPITIPCHANVAVSHNVHCFPQTPTFPSQCRRPRKTTSRRCWSRSATS